MNSIFIIHHRERLLLFKITIKLDGSWLKIIAMRREISINARINLSSITTVLASGILVSRMPINVAHQPTKRCCVTVTSVVKQILHGAAVYALCVSWRILRRVAITNTVQQGPGIRAEALHFLLGAPITRLLLQ